MPCKNTLAPAVGCRGPGTDSACAYCRDYEKQQKKFVIPQKPLPKPPIQPKASVPQNPVTTPPIVGKKLPAIPLKPQQAAKLVADTPASLKSVAINKPAEVTCAETPPKPPPYKLVKLEVQRACGAPGSWWQVVSSDQTVEIKATTAPDAPSAWKRLNWGTNVQQVSRSAEGRQEVACHMDSDPAQSVRIDIYDLSALTPAAGTVSGGRVKVYETNTDLVITASTNPNEAKVWDLVQWDGQVTLGPPGSDTTKPGSQKNQRKVALSPARDVKVVATLGCNPDWGQKKHEITVHICKWPDLEVQQILFDSRPVLNDGTSQIGKQFDNKWIRGRLDPSANCITQSVQSPICYPGNSKITVSVELSVLEKPTEDEKVWVMGSADCGGTKLEWWQKITVSAAATKVSMVNVASDNPLPDGVALHNPLTIKWYMIESDNKTWRQIGSTQHLLYVTLGERQPNNLAAYWTLLDISCRAAAGTTTENTFVPAAFAPFATHTGDGNGFRRKGDDVELSYYKDGVNTGAEKAPEEASPYFTKGILARADGTGRCGGWANLLRHMFQLHGVISARNYDLEREWEGGKPNYGNRFLVKSCSFSPVGTLKNCLPYTHKGNVECLKKPGAAGQGKTNPQFDFGDHVFVEHDGKFYDPSYGIGPLIGQFAYEEAAIDGLGTYNVGAGKMPFNQSGTPQHIPDACSPGYVVRVVSNSDKLTDIAPRFGVTPEAILNHPMNAALKTLRGTVDKVQPGDRLYIPRDWAKGGQRLILYGYYE